MLQAEPRRDKDKGSDGGEEDESAYVGNRDAEETDEDNDEAKRLAFCWG